MPNDRTQDLIVTRVFDAPISEVWQAWVEPKQIKQWWGPTGFSCPLAKIDFRLGGTSLVGMRAPKELGGQDQYSLWQYTKIVPMERIEYTFSFADSDGNKIDPAAAGLPPGVVKEQHHVVTFKTIGTTKTELTVTERDWPVGQMMDMSRLGLEQCLDKMAKLLS